MWGVRWEGPLLPSGPYRKGKISAAGDSGMGRPQRGRGTGIVMQSPAMGLRLGSLGGDTFLGSGQWHTLHSTVRWDEQVYRPTPAPPTHLTPIPSTPLPHLNPSLLSPTHPHILYPTPPHPIPPRPIPHTSISYTPQPQPTSPHPHSPPTPLLPAPWAR